jgi:Tol biopolymer transport system component
MAAVATAAAAGTPATAWVPAVPAGTVTLVSLTSAGVQGDRRSGLPVTAGDGRFVAFMSHANLAPNDDRNSDEIYVRDRLAGTTELVSVGVTGSANGGHLTDISSSGRYVVFNSARGGHVRRDINSVGDVFVRDMTRGVTERVSVDSSENQATGRSYQGVVSDDGRYVAFTSGAPLSRRDNAAGGPGRLDVYVRDRVLGTTRLVSITRAGGPGHGQLPDISANGRFVSFTSNHGGLVKDDTAGYDVFVRDLLRSRTRKVSVASNGGQANGAGSYYSSISASGRYVAFSSVATNLVARDRNDASDLFVHDRRGGTTSMVSVNTRGRQSGGHSEDPIISGNGRFVLFTSSADFIDGGRRSAVYLRDLAEGTTVTVPGPTANAGLSKTGHTVVFASDNDSLVPGDSNLASDVFALDW